MWPYYVYELADPRDGRTFYVGKGKGARIDAHEKEARKGVSSPKCNKIREIQGAGFAVVRRHVAYFREEKDAYAHEAKRIITYGLKNLTNEQLVDRDPVRQVWLSDAGMRVLAYAYKFDRGVLVPANNPSRPWGAALTRAFARRAKEFINKATTILTFEEARDGLAPYGIIVTNGGEA
jgi:hypothetical protein